MFARYAVYDVLSLCKFICCLASGVRRFIAVLMRSDPETAEKLFDLAQRDIDDQWHFYEQMAGVERDVVQEQNPHDS